MKSIRRLQRCLCWMLLAALLLSFPAEALAASSKSGKCGKNGSNLTWKFKDGVLTISGKGEMADYFVGRFDGEDEEDEDWVDEEDEDDDWDEEDEDDDRDEEDEEDEFSYGSPWFLYCGYIKEIRIKSGVTSIGSSAFTDCENLKRVSLPEGLKSIGEGAFYCCSRLKSLKLPEGLKSIGDLAFAGCWKLSEIDLPGSLTGIGDGAFLACDNLTEIRVSSRNPVFRAIDGVLFSKDGTQLILYPPGLDASPYTVPEGVTSIGEAAFAECENLKRVILPEGLKSIGEDAFADCEKLTLTVPAGSFAEEYCIANGLNYTLG